jgi:TolA-binding protein
MQAESEWEHHQFGSAKNLYERWLNSSHDSEPTATALARFRVASCAIELQHADAENEIQEFMENFPESPLVQEAQWKFANFLYRKRDWKEAISAFNQIRTNRMRPSQKYELQFKRGHAQFELEQYDEARLDLFAVMESPEESGPYAANAQYYFSHISYIKGQPQVALTGFQSLSEHSKFTEIVPIYIAQLLHETEQFDDLIAYAPSVLHEDSPINEVQRADLSRLVGDALYRQQRFSEALPYLEESYTFSRGRERTRQFAYQMGFVYYQEKEYRKALNCFTLSVRELDELAQNGIYHMADCYLSLGQKDKARTTFKKASELNFDTEIKEDALFSYAKLAYELSYNPFDDAIGAVERYLEEFPNSRRKQEAYGFLLEVYMSSKNYDRALNALERIEDKTLPVQRAFQIVAYNRGVELFKTGKYDQAMPYFNSVRTYAVDPILTAESYFWQGELSYLLKRYMDATGHYAAFESSPGAYQSEHYTDGIYARGYSLFKRKVYLDALGAFRSYLKAAPNGNPTKIKDAKLRTADCFFAQKDFEAASRYYQEVIESSESTEDYARLQSAECLGSLDRPFEEIQVLEALIEVAPGSSYVPEALYSLGRSFIETNQLVSARNVMERIQNEFPNCARFKYALVDLCLIGVKEGRENDALKIWDIIRQDYGKDAIAGDAFNVVEPLLMDRGLLDNIPSGVGLNGDQIEERLFDAARSLALERTCEKATTRLREYIRSYPEGRFLTEAHFFVGNCLYDNNRVSEARIAFEYVLNQPPGDYSEHAALGAATIAWNAEDWSGALGHYRTLEVVSMLKENVLEARIGLMRCLYLLEQPEEALNYANLVIEESQTPEDILRTAIYWRGKITFERNDPESARLDLVTAVNHGGERGAECQYLLCLIEFQKQKFAETEILIFKLIDQFSSHDEWKFKAFLLLVDTYIQMEDWFQARTTVQSILDNVPIEWVQKKARMQLDELNQLEQDRLLENSSRDLLDTIRLGQLDAETNTLPTDTLNTRKP